jgi:2-polyprenyl-3-methyl-5-hydroxy-6-metoxy-1,4-benzoquinol methylase
MTQKCKICNERAKLVFIAKILNKYDVGYYQCVSCKFLQTEDTYWLEESYKSAININDTGIVFRNEIFRRITSTLFYFWLNPKGKFIDFAGGYGIFTRMMRDVGFDYYWVDTYADNLLSRGFEHKPQTIYEGLTAFEVFEHMVNPLADIEAMLKYSDTIVFSTELLPDTLPETSWWYYAFNHGQHVAFYNRKTLETIAAKYQLNLLSNGSNFHIFTRKKVNPLVYKLLLKASKYGLYNWVKLQMKSRRFSDHLLLSTARN